MKYIISDRNKVNENLRNNDIQHIISVYDVGRSPLQINEAMRVLFLNFDDEEDDDSEHSDEAGEGEESEDSEDPDNDSEHR